MNSIFQVLYNRRPVLNYVAPPVCETLFSGTGAPVIVLDPIASLGPVTGLVLGGVGGFQLSWNRYPGAICYSVYQADNADEPFGTYHLIAECIPDATFTLPPGGTYRVTVITRDGESPPSAPVTTTGGGGTTVVRVEATTEETKFGEDPGVFTFFRTEPFTNPLVVKYLVTGDAVPGTDYVALLDEVTIPAGQEYVDVPVVPLDAAGETETLDVVVTIVPNVPDNYGIGSPSTADIIILPPDFSCGATPDSIQDAVWTDKEVSFPFGGDIIAGVGSFSITITTSSTAASKVTTICNPGAAYDITVNATDMHTPGTIFPFTHSVGLQLYINDVLVDSAFRDAFLEPISPDITLTGTLPAEATCTIELRAVYFALGNPSSTFYGTLNITPTTPP